MRVCFDFDRGACTNANRAIKYENTESVTDCSLLRDLDSDRVFDASYILQVSSLELSCAFTNPEHMSRAVVVISCKHPTYGAVAGAIISRAFDRRRRSELTEPKLIDLDYSA